MSRLGKLAFVVGLCDVKGMQWIDPVHLSHQLVQVATQLRRLLLRAYEDSESLLDVNLLRREIAWSKKLLDELRAMPEITPMRDTWLVVVGHLALQQHTLEPLIDYVQARAHEQHAIVGMGKRKWTVDDLLRDLSREKLGGRREQAAVALEQIASSCTDTSARWLLSRPHVVRHLGFANVDQLETPLSGALTRRQLALSVLDATESIARQAFEAVDFWQDAVRMVGAYDALYGWPVRLTERWAVDTLLHPTLLRGLPPPRHLRLPEAINGASFVRAAAQVGAAYYRAVASDAGVPLAWLLAPSDSGPSTYGALVASQLATSLFARKRLRLSRHVAQEQSRMLATTMLSHVRTSALQSLLAQATTPEQLLDVYASHGSRALGGAIPQRLLGVIPKINPAATSVITGALSGATLVHHAVHQYDEDWFDNPRCLAWLRECSAIPQPPCDETLLDVPLSNLVEWFEDRIA